MQNVDIVNLYAAIICVVSSFLILFIYCYYGSTATDDFFKYSQCIYESSWYEWPPKLQGTITVIIGNAQQAMFFDGWGMFALDLMAFSKVRFRFYASINYLFRLVNEFLDPANSSQLLPDVQDIRNEMNKNIGMTRH